MDAAVESGADTRRTPMLELIVVRFPPERLGLPCPCRLRSIAGSTQQDQSMVAEAAPERGPHAHRKILPTRTAVLGLEQREPRAARPGAPSKGTGAPGEAQGDVGVPACAAPCGHPVKAEIIIAETAHDEPRRAPVPAPAPADEVGEPTPLASFLCDAHRSSPADTYASPFEFRISLVTVGSRAADTDGVPIRGALDAPVRDLA